MRWRFAGVVGKPRLILLGWFCAAMLAVMGTAFFSMMADDSYSRRLDTGGPDTTYLLGTGPGTHHTHPLLAAILWTGALATVALTWRAGRRLAL
jgi:hypothetical protein